MANASIAQSVNRATVAAALRQARKDAAHHQAWLNAINRAALNLEACPWAFDGDDLHISSATDSSLRYIVDAAGCDCTAGLKGIPCWHRAARRLLIKAAEMTQGVWYKGFFHTPADLKAAAQARKAAGYIDAEVQAKADEMFT